MPTQKQPELKEKIEIPEGMCPCFDSKYDKLGDIEDMCLLNGGEADIETCHRKYGAATCPVLMTLSNNLPTRPNFGKKLNQSYILKAIEFYRSLR